MTERRETGGQARFLELRDMPEATELYRSISTGARLRAEEEVRRKLTECFLEVPYPGGARAVVHEGGDGRLVGFMGMFSRRWNFAGRCLDGATVTAIVVDPKHPDSKLSALKMTRLANTQPYDFALCDRPDILVTKMRTGPGVARAAATNVAVRSHIINGHGYRFSIALRPTDHTRQQVRNRLRWKRYWPVLAPIDRLASRLAIAWDNRHPATTTGKRPDGVTLEDATPETVLETRLALAQTYTLCMVDDAPLSKWQYDFLRDYPSRGRFRWLIARMGRDPIGWFLYYVREDQPSELASIVAVPRYRAAVVNVMLATATDDGCTGLVGTTSMVMAHELLECGATIHQADRLLVAARDEAVIEAFRSTEVLVTGLEGEYWI